MGEGLVHLFPFRIFAMFAEGKFDRFIRFIFPKRELIHQIGEISQFHVGRFIYIACPRLCTYTDVKLVGYMYTFLQIQQ